MKVLHLTTFLQGGAGLVIAALAAAQHQAGHDVTVVTSSTPEPGYGNYPAHLQTLRSAGVPVHAVDSLFKRSAAAAANVGALLRRLYGTETAPDLVHAHAAVPSAIALAFATDVAAPVPVLQTMHGWGVAKSPEHRRHDVDVLNRVGRVIVPSRASAALLAELGVADGQVRVIPYGVADRGAPTMSPSVASDLHHLRARGGQLVCCAGTIGPRKNQRAVVEALALLRDDPRVHAVFVGDGDAMGLQEAAALRGVADRVHCYGYQPDARHIVAACDWCVLPSFSEGQPLAVLEAFCDGVPVLASRIPELVEIVVEGVSGLLFDPTSAADLARALRSALRLPRSARTALVARARAEYRSRFRFGDMMRRYMHEYQALRTPADRFRARVDGAAPCA
jgi:L-malate glycosyltransferase